MDFLQQYIKKIGEGIKTSIKDQRNFTAIVLVLVALTAFGLGRQSVGEFEKVGGAAVEEVGLSPAPSTAKTTNDSKNINLPSTYYVGSVNGEVYHLPHCSGAQRISEQNKVIFKTKTEAEAAGYRPAANCKGI